MFIISQTGWSIFPNTCLGSLRRWPTHCGWRLLMYYFYLCNYFNFSLNYVPESWQYPVIQTFVFDLFLGCADIWGTMSCEIYVNKNALSVWVSVCLSVCLSLCLSVSRLHWYVWISDFPRKVVNSSLIQYLLTYLQNCCYTGERIVHMFFVKCASFTS